MKAYDVMTKDVITVGPTTTVAEIAAVLVRHRIGAVPVVSDGKEVIGIISQTDLAHRSEIETARKRQWWLKAFADPNTEAREYVRSHGLKAEDVMTRFVVSVCKDDSLAEVADILDAYHLRQVLVMDNGALVGIISRADLVRKLAEVKIGPRAARPDNSALHKAIRDRLKAQPWLNTASVNFTVKDGVVQLWGAVDSSDQHRALRVLVEGTAGVQRVENHITLLPKSTSA